MTDTDRIRAMRAVRDAAREASRNNLALATGATIGALALLLHETEDGPGGTRDDLLELAIAKLRELVTGRTS